MFTEMIIVTLGQLACLIIHLIALKKIWAQMGEQWNSMRDQRNEMIINNLKMMNEASKKLHDYVANYEESRATEIKTLFRELEMAQASIEGIRNVNIKSLEADGANRNIRILAHMERIDAEIEKLQKNKKTKAE